MIIFIEENQASKACHEIQDKVFFKTFTFTKLLMAKFTLGKPSAKDGI